MQTPSHNQTSTLKSSSIKENHHVSILEYLSEHPLIGFTNQEVLDIHVEFHKIRNYQILDSTQFARNLLKKYIEKRISLAKELEKYTELLIEMDEQKREPEFTYLTTCNKIKESYDHALSKMNQQFLHFCALIQTHTDIRIVNIETSYLDENHLLLGMIDNSPEALLKANIEDYISFK